MNLYDSIAATRVPIADRLSNLVSGLGTQKDKATTASFTHLWLNKYELDAMYEGDWLAGTIIDAIPDDMTREWRGWSGGKNQVAAMDRAERQFGVQQRVNLALKQARLYGGSVIILGTGDPNPELPLDLDTLPKGGLSYLHVLSKWEITASEVNRDPLSPTFGEPSYYTLATPTVAPVGQGQQQYSGTRIHPTRVVRFLGQARLELSRADEGWGLPTLQRVYDAVSNATAASQAVASLMQEAKIDVVRIPSLTTNVADAGYTSRLLQRFALANMAKSINGMLLLDKEEEWQQKQIRLTELPAAVMLFLEIAAGAANMPLTRLLGKSPGGLGSNGDAEIRHYYDTVSSRQNVELRPALTRLDVALKRHALGANPDTVDYGFRPLWQMTPAEKAAIALQKAQATQIYAQLKLVPFMALALGTQSQLVSDDVYPGFESALEAEIEAGRQVTEPVPVVLPVDAAKPNSKPASAGGDE